MIDDESKKFIKDTIEDAIDKKLDDRDKKSAAQKRIEDLKNEKKSLEDRKKLLAELQERDKKGENTIAQKFEMLKLSVDNAIPQDLKDAYSGASKTIGSGASQVGKGLGHLTQKAMLSNPLTAFLYQNRDVFGAVGDIGIGAAKMGWGAVKGIGHGALGLANTAMNMFKPKEEEQTEEEEYELPKTLFGGKEESLTDKLADEQQDWQKKINQMHKILTQDLSKEQKKSSDIMSKGLGGLNKTMEAIKGFTDVIASKQKLILGGVLLGAAAIVGLAAWFKSGGLLNILRAGQNKINEKGVSGAQNQANNMVDVYNHSGLKDGGIDLSNQNVTKDSDIKVTNLTANIPLSVQNEDGTTRFLKEKDYQKDYGASQSTAYLISKKGLGQGNAMSKREFSNESNSITKIAFPVSVTLKYIEFDKEKQGASIMLEKAQVTKGVKERLKYATGTMPRIIISDVLELFIPKNVVIKPNTTICHVAANYQIWGNLQEFLRGEKFEDYTNKNMQTFESDKNLREYYKDEKFVKNLAKSENEAMKQTSRNVAVQSLPKDMIGKVADSVEDQMETEQPSNQEQMETPSVSTNQVKADEQNKKLNESTKKTETEKTSNNDVQGQKLSSASTTMQLPGTGYRYADKGLTTTEYNNMRDTDIV